MSEGDKGSGNKSGSDERALEVSNTPSEHPISVKAEVSAKAEASVKLTGTIPESSLGRALDSLVDIIRPFSERRGLRADVIRLQREEVAIEIARRTAERIALEAKPIIPVPLKTLVPLLEYGSREDPDDSFMIDRWAALLATAATENTVSPRLVSLLSEVNGRQAQLLANIARHRAGFIDVAVSLMAARIATEVQKRRPPNLSQPELTEIIETVGPGLLIVDFTRLDSAADAWNTTRLFEADAERQRDLHILQSLSLIDFDGPDVPHRTEGMLRITNAIVAFLGTELLQAVKAIDRPA